VPKASDIEAWSKCFSRRQLDDVLGWSTQTSTSVRSLKYFLSRSIYKEREMLLAFNHRDIS